MNSSCPELTWTGARFACGLVLNAPDPAAKKKIIDSLGIGDGCPHADSLKRIARARKYQIDEIDVSA